MKNKLIPTQHLVGRDTDIAQIVFVCSLVNTPSLQLTSTGIVVVTIARRRCRFHLSLVIILKKWAIFLMEFGCWRFLRKDQKKDPFPFLSYKRKSYRLIIVAWKQIPVSSVLVHFPSSLDEFIHSFHSTRVLDEFIHSFHSTRVLDEFIHLFHSTCVLDEFIHLFHSTLSTHSCGVPYTQ